MPVIIAISNTATITLIAALRFDDVFCFSIYLQLLLNNKTLHL